MLNINNNKNKKVLPEFPAALYLALLLAVGHRRCMFEPELISHRILDLRQLAKYFTGVGDTSAILSNRVFQRTKLQHVVVIKKTLSFVGVDTNKVIILSVNKLYKASTPDKTEAMQLNHCHGDQ